MVENLHTYKVRRGKFYTLYTGGKTTKFILKLGKRYTFILFKRLTDR